MSEWTKMTVAQLKAELTKRSLDKTGTKADLVTRLIMNDSATTEMETNGEAECDVIEGDITLGDVTLGDSSIEVPEVAQVDPPVTEEAKEDKRAEEDYMEVGEQLEENEDDDEAEEFVIKEELNMADTSRDDSKLEDPIDIKKENTDDKVETDEKEGEDGEKSDKKGKKGPKKWVAIMENEKTSKVLDELSKINKLDCLKGRAKEIFMAHEAHKVRIFPMLPDDLNDPLIIEVIRKSVSCMMKFTSSDPDVEPKGLLEVTFSRRSVLDEYTPKLALFKESVNVIIDKKEHEWKDLYRQSTDRPENASDLEKLRLFAPSLPQSVQEADMWDYFPNAREMLLIEAKPRKHAYITFSSEDSMIKSVEELNNRGPQKDDFKFCRLLRLADVVQLIPRRGEKGPRRGADGPRGGPQTPKTGPRGGQRTPKTGPRGGQQTPKTGPKAQRGPQRKQRPAGPGPNANRKPQKSAKSGKPSPRQAESSGPRSKDIQRKRNSLGLQHKDDYTDRRSSYWGAAPRQRGRGAGLQSSFSQLQQPSPLVHPQAQQGLQVLDTLLSTLGQMGNVQQQPGPMSRHYDRRGNEPKPRNDSGTQKRSRSPFTGRNKRRRKGPQDSPRQSYGDSRRDNYGPSSSYGGDMGSSSMGYSHGDDYRQSGQGTDRIYNALDAVNKITRLRESLSHSGQRQDQYGVGGGSYRQDSYY